MKFRKENWNTVGQLNRLKMAEELVETHALDGKYNIEIKQMLGEKTIILESPKSIRYIVGSNISDPWVLGIYFDSEGKVSEYGIYDG
jgi:hypothetical protein